MPNIYRIQQDFGFASLNLDPDDPRRRGVTKLRFWGESVSSKWDPPLAYIGDRSLPRADIWFGLKSSAPMFLDDSLALLRPLLEPVGELLPLATEDGLKFMVLNVTYVEDVLDEPHCIRNPPPLDAVTHYAFDLSKLKHSLFRIRGDSTQVFTVEGLFPPEREFKAQVEMHGLTGVSFREAWFSDQPIFKMPF